MGSASAKTAPTRFVKFTGKALPYMTYEFKMLSEKRWELFNCVKKN